jgi:hypothetical protein
LLVTYEVAKDVCNPLTHLYVNGKVIKSMRMMLEGYVARMGEGRCAYRVSIGKPEETKPLGRPRRRWEDNIKVDLTEITIDGSKWIRLA